MSLLDWSGSLSAAGPQGRSDVSEFRRRFRWIALAMTLLFLALIGRLFQLQVLEGVDNKAIARENIVRRITLATTRGILRDKNGKVLAASRPAYNVYVVPERLDMLGTWPKLVDYLRIGVDERARLEAHLVALRAEEGPSPQSQQILLKEDIVADAVAILATHDAELVGVDVVPVPVRYYPYEEIGAHVLGYMAEVDADKLVTLAQLRLRRRRPHRRDRHRAIVGELPARNARLGEGPGRREGPASPGGEGIIDEPRRVDPIPGRDLRLTLDADIQKAIEKAMRGELAGGVALVDVRTGRILGLYSKPSYDPNALSGGSGKQVIRDAFRRLYSDPLKPALDKTVSGAYPPGSTFKPFTALAALEKGLIDPRATIAVQRVPDVRQAHFRCTHVHGAVDLHEAHRRVVQRLLLSARRRVRRRHGPSSPRWRSASGSAARPASASTPRRAGACRRAPG